MFARDIFAQLSPNAIAVPSAADAKAITSARKSSRLLGAKSQELAGLSNFSPIFGIGETPEMVHAKCMRLSHLLAGLSRKCLREYLSV